MRALFSLLRRFAAHKRGNVAMIFGLTALVLIIMTGGAVDMSRTMSTKSDLQDAADAAALQGALIYSSQGLTASQTAANKAFLADFNIQGATNVQYTLTATTSGNITQLTYTATATITPYFLGLVGINTQTITAVSKAQSQVNPFELVFVLDTTGSMAGTRITNLKSSVNSVLTTLYNMEGNSSDDVKIGIVPFDTQVRMTASSAYNYVDYTNCASHSSVDYHACLAVWDVYGKICASSSTVSTCQSRATSEMFYKTDSSGKAYITAYAYDGSGSKYNIYKYTETFYIDSSTLQKVVTNATLTTTSATSTSSYKVTSVSGYTQFSSSYFDSLSSSWGGCLTDRYQSYDVSVDPAVSTEPDTLYPAATCAVTALPVVTDLTNNITSVQTAVTALTTGGNTNITVGLQFGMEMLSPDTPYTNGVAWDDEDVDKYMILVTDGENTQNRWTSTTSSIDARTALACSAVKAKGITLFVVNVIEGNSTLLQTCASQTSYYYKLSSASQLSDAMTSILESIGKLRLVQ